MEFFVNRPIKYALGLALILTLAAAGWWWNHSSSQANNSKQTDTTNQPGGRRRGGGPITVSASAARIGDVPEIWQANATIAAPNTVVLRPRINGIVTQVLFKEGQIVKQGDVLLRLDDRALQIAVEQARGQAQRDQAQLNQAKLDLIRLEALFKEQAIALQQLETQRALTKQLEGTSLVSQANLKDAQLQLSFTRVIAPVSGIIGLKRIGVGSPVSTSDTNGFATLSQYQNSLEALFALPSRYLSPLLAASSTLQKMTVEAWSNDGEQRLATGHLVALDNQIDLSTDTINVKAVLQQPKQQRTLFPNQFVSLRIIANVLKNTLIVPETAIQKGLVDGKMRDFVYVLKASAATTPNNNSAKPIFTAKRVVVDIATTYQGLAALKTNPLIEAGAQIVMDGFDNLRDGASVQVAPGNLSERSKPKGVSPGTSEKKQANKLNKP